jgi:hypothetical protein
MITTGDSDLQYPAQARRLLPRPGRGRGACAPSWCEPGPIGPSVVVQVNLARTGEAIGLEAGYH